MTTQEQTVPGWHVFHATGRAPDGPPPQLPEPPAWRQFRGGPPQPRRRATRKPRCAAWDPVTSYSNSAPRRPTSSTRRCCCADRCWSPGRQA